MPRPWSRRGVDGHHAVLRTFGPQTTVEEHLAGHPEALAGLQHVLQRADRAARFAASFAIHRADHDAVVLCEAAQLHDFTRCCCGCMPRARARAPAPPACRLDAALQHGTARRAQRRAERRQHVLMKLWRLPILVRITTTARRELAGAQRAAGDPPARHTMNGWENRRCRTTSGILAGLLHLGLERRGSCCWISIPN